jgi:cobalamin biosynthesis Mg chelatase CobN
LYTIELKIKDDAPLGKSEINFAGVFCDWELNDYEVNCESGTINVKCNHQVDEWEVVKEATDTEEGSRQGICVKCGETVTEVIAAKGTSGDDNKADDSNSSDKTDDSNSGNKTSDKTDNSNSGNKTSDKTDDSKSDVSNSTSKSTDTTKTAVKTGDTAVGVVFVIMMVATGTTVVVLKKKQHG